MYLYKNWCVIIPMANEEDSFSEFIGLLKNVLDVISSGKVYLVIDDVSKDETLILARQLSQLDDRFVAVYKPSNKNVVDAYMAGYQIAYEKGHDLIIEMDAGLSHDPRALPMFLRVLNEGNECAFGSRFINGGSMGDSPFKRRFISKTGTVLSNLLLGTKMYDMTSGFQGMHRDVVKELLSFNLKSTAHFYQTEVRYLLRKKRFCEIPIHYKAPSTSISKKAISNAYLTLFYYFWQRLIGNIIAL